MLKAEDYIIKIITGEITGSERSAFFKELSADQELAGQYAQVKNSYVFETLPYDGQGLQAWERDGKAKRLAQKNGTMQHRLSSFFIKVAAVLFIPLAIYVGFDKFSKTVVPQESDGALIANVIKVSQKQANLKYFVKNGVKGQVELPDGSLVWLNSGSTLEFPAQFDTAVRVVKLSGEAFFKVESDKKWPLCVMTPQGITAKVTGTQFNLSCYEDDANFKLTLVSGAVSLINLANNNEINVKPLEEIVIPNNKIKMGHLTVATKLKTSIESTTAWKEGVLIFDNTPMLEVVKKIERWYGVDITVKNDKFYSFNYTATFDCESISIVLETLKATSGISYSLKDNKVELY